MSKTKVNNKGYLEFIDSGKLVHIWKAEKKYGVENVRGMHVHHIDGDKRNNDYSNLILLSKEDHYDLHQNENKKKFLTEAIISLSVLYSFYMDRYSNSPTTSTRSSEYYENLSYDYPYYCNRIKIWIYITGYEKAKRKDFPRLTKVQILFLSLGNQVKFSVSCAPILFTNPQSSRTHKLRLHRRRGF